MKANIDAQITDDVALQILHALEEITKGEPKDLVVDRILRKNTYEEEGDMPSMRNLILDSVEDYHTERISLDELKEIILALLLEYGKLKNQSR